MSMTAQRSRTSRERRVRHLTLLAVVAAVLRNHRFQENVAVGAIVLAALAGVGREIETRSSARALAWVKKFDQRAERAIKVREQATADAVKKASRHGRI
jgi:hypothetical protein